MPTDRSGVAVLLSCHGTVERLEDIAAFVRNIRHGRPAPDEVVNEVTRRHQHIGGSPFMRITHQQAEALESRLHLSVRAAGRLWEPYPKQVLVALKASGIDRVISLPLAPQSVHVYNQSVEEAAVELGMSVVAAPSWGLEPLLVDAFVDAIAEARDRIEPCARKGVAIVLTAHSLPRRVIDAGDPYERDFSAMARAVMDRLAERGMNNATRIAFQSQGMGGGEWLGPDLKATFSELRSQGIDDLVIAPIGFLAEHVETLYDIDVEAAALAHELRFRRFERMPAMDTRPRFIDALEAVVRKLLDSAPARSC